MNLQAAPSQLCNGFDATLSSWTPSFRFDVLKRPMDARRLRKKAIAYKFISNLGTRKTRLERPTAKAGAAGTGLVVSSLGDSVRT